MTYGVGFSLQEAADDLIARLVGIALGARSSGLRNTIEVSPPDVNMLAFIADLGDLAARGEDIRPRVFG
ncbi:hypothetical protein DVA67_008815 [Solirubrobacter sp. CPCC 204708]|uniref:Uncharacterized protein n=1 Tax=Solirubrobacter deserti TaxID=2282478 RepID=A0ABT4RES9_9ACTN|nr:hypothetical protein [Solirubrobacter deserti]MBE2316075.1 hypothetical protein [Solirubrobacter deserti]MDA0136825.1 hypothetical protein [Solirubrobacter deserti]